MQHAKEHFAEDTQLRILEAAKDRFQLYGYNKTTMAEIAKDCDMSAANLYRYFENKLAIGAALAGNCLDEGVDKLRELILDKQIAPSDKLREFIVITLDHTYTRWSETPRMNEMVTAICHERTDIVDQHVQKKQALLISLIKEGNQLGEFDVADPEVTAEAILTANTLFGVPLLMPLFSREAFERKAKNLATLLLHGILKQS
jgi:AcrR family transcriptional regulator